LGRVVASELNGVVNAGTTLGGSENTTRVVLPGLSISANGERHGAEGGVHGRFTLCYRDYTPDGSTNGTTGRGTVSILSSVRIRGFGILSSLADDPVHGLVRPAAIATRSFSITIHDFLRSEPGALSNLLSNKIGGLDSFSGREAPARTTLLLILHWSSSTLGNPIDSGSRVLFFSPLDLGRVILV